MAFGVDDDDRESVASSENDQDDLMEDVDEADAEVYLEGDAEEEDNDDDGDDNEEEDAEPDEIQDQISNSPHQSQSQQQSQSQLPTDRSSLPETNTSSDDISIPSQAGYTNGEAGPTSHPHQDVLRTSASPKGGSPPLPPSKYTFTVRPEALSASLYDIVPTMAAPQGTSINAIAATPDMRFWFTGGSDCYVRKYDGAATVNGKTLLTVAQRHPFVDTVTKAGVLMSYWENEEPNSKVVNEEPALTPVYSLAVHHEALWLLSGLESGCINLQSVRHDEGKRIAYLHKHTSAVSVLTLSQDEKSVLSGSWDKNVFDWDLNTGKVKRSFMGGGGQISAIEVRPASSLPVPEESGEPVFVSDTFSTNNGSKTLTNGFLANGINGHSNGVAADTENTEDALGSPADTDSLFGGGGDVNSLFGDNDGVGAPSGGNFGADDDDEFSRAIEMGIDQQDQGETQPDVAMTDVVIPGLQNEENSIAPAVQLPGQSAATEPDATASIRDLNSTLTNGLPKAETLEGPLKIEDVAPETQDAIATSDSTFLAASVNGTLRIWDRRQPNAVARIPNRPGVPPWCMGACWSPDGNYIYAGRRNGTVEEFSLHKGLKAPERTFKFPQGSGAVSAVRSMPNGRHLICASHDILRLYDLKESQAFKHSTVPFLIVPGPPRAGVISSLHIDPTCRYMLSAAGNRGWEGSTTEVLIGYEIGIVP